MNRRSKESLLEGRSGWSRRIPVAPGSTTVLMHLASMRPHGGRLVSSVMNRAKAGHPMRLCCLNPAPVLEAGSRTRGLAHSSAVGTVEAANSDSRTAESLQKGGDRDQLRTGLRERGTKRGTDNSTDAAIIPFSLQPIKKHCGIAHNPVDDGD